MCRIQGSKTGIHVKQGTDLSRLSPRTAHHYYHRHTGYAVYHSVCSQWARGRNRAATALSRLL